jgi:hypothetical protein
MCRGEPRRGQEVRGGVFALRFFQGPATKKQICPGQQSMLDEIRMVPSLVPSISRSLPRSLSSSQWRSYTSHAK